MADNPVISQIQVGNTTYDIIDTDTTYSLVANDNNQNNPIPIVTFVSFAEGILTVQTKYLRLTSD